MSRVATTIGTRHLVEELTFALQFTSIEPLGRPAEDVGRDLIEGLLPAVEQALDDVARGDRARNVETVEVDLGSISAHGVSEADRTRLRELIAAALGMVQRSAPEALAADEAALPPRQGASATASPLRSARSPDELVHQVTAMAAASGGPVPELTAALRRRLASLGDPEPFLRNVLARLAAGEVIDLERAAAATTPATDALGTADAGGVVGIGTGSAHAEEALDAARETPSSAARERAETPTPPRRARGLSPAVAHSLLAALRTGQLDAATVVTVMAVDDLPELIAALAEAARIDFDIERARLAVVEGVAPEQAATRAIDQLLAGRSPQLETWSRAQEEPLWLQGYKLAQAMLAGQTMLTGTSARAGGPPLHDRLHSAAVGFLRNELSSKPQRTAVLLLAAAPDARSELAAMLGLDLEIPDVERLAHRAIERALEAEPGAVLAAAARQQPELVAARLRAMDDQAAVRRVVMALDERELAALALALRASPADLASLETGLAGGADVPRPLFWQTAIGILSARGAGQDWAGVVADRLGLRPLHLPRPAIPARAVLAAYAAFGEAIAGRVAPGALATATGTMRRSLPSLLGQLKAGLTNGTPPVAALTVGRTAREIRGAVVDILAATSAGDVEELERTLVAGEAAPDATQRFAAVLAAVADDAPLDLQAPKLRPSLGRLEVFLAGSPATPEAAILARAVLTTRPLLAASLVRAHTKQSASRLGRLLDNDARARLLAALQPETAGALAAATERLAGALMNRVADTRELLWAVVLETAAAEQRVDPGDFVARAVEVLAERRGVRPAIVAGELRSALERRATTDPEGEALAVSLARLAVGRAPAASAATDAEAWTTDDAGAVLLAPYLPRLFERDGLMVEGVLAEGSARSVARALVELAVWGAPLAEPRPGSSRVAALLAGVPPELPPMPAELAPTAGALVEGLLEAVIANWGALGQTSVAGLREAFLRRPGVLRESAEGWRLSVEPRAYDMLLDRLPWSYGVVGHRWMPKPLFVEWR